MINYYHMYSLIISLVAIVIVFLFAVDHFSKSVHSVFGNSFEKYIKKFTNTPLKGAGAGAFITAIFQSSTAVSVLIVSLAGAGIIPLANGLALMIGANIGTTVTSQLVAFKILDIAPYILIIGFVLMYTNNPFKKYGPKVFYFGLMFSALYLVSLLTSSFQTMPWVLNMIAQTSNIWIALVVGFVVTNLFQSSSMTTALVVIFASQGILDVPQAFGILLGANMGTTATALLASLATNTTGKQVALGNFIFNMVGALIFIPLIPIFVSFVTSLASATEVQVALAHIIFNIIIAGIFLLGFKYFVRVVKWVVPS